MSTNGKRSGDKPSRTKRSASAEQVSGFFDDVEQLVSRVTHLPDAEIARVWGRGPGLPGPRGVSKTAVRDPVLRRFVGMHLQQL